MNIVYGTGLFGNLLYDHFMHIGVSIDCFCQTIIDRDDKCCGLPVRSIDDVMSLSGDKAFFIAIKNKNVSNQIKQHIKSLRLLGGDKCAIYEYGEFISGNLNSPSGDKLCILCDNKTDVFADAGVDETLFRVHRIIGGGRRTNVVYPHCGSIDRYRWCYYVLAKYTNIFNLKCKVLHFAPEKVIKEYIQANIQCDYYPADIDNCQLNHIIDVTDIQFKDNTFDYIIINHVMEHVPDEEIAIKELKRVLKPSGKMIMSFPICLDMPTIEETESLSKNERLRLFGQEDHVRLYGYDYKERIEKYGFRVTVYRPKDELDKFHIEKYGLIEDDVIMICSKN